MCESSYILACFEIPNVSHIAPKLLNASKKKIIGYMWGVFGISAKAKNFRTKLFAVIYFQIATNLLVIKKISVRSIAQFEHYLWAK